MWISQKNYQKALDEQKEMLNLEWETKWKERDERYWQRESENQRYEEMNRHFANIEKRLHLLEKKAGLVEEKPICPHYDNLAVAPGF